MPKSNRISTAGAIPHLDSGESERRSVEWDI